MTTKMLTAIACLGAAIGLTASTAAAQSMETVRVNLPYDTKAGGVTLPAGKYEIRDITNSGSSAVLQISSDEHKGVNAFVTARQVVAPKDASVDHTKVVLHQDDNGSYALQSIFVEGQDVGFALNAE